MQPGVNVFAVLDLRESAGGLEGLASVQRAGADADRSVDPVPRRQDPAVEQLLRRARRALNPVQVLAAVEVLRALYDADGRIIHVRHQVPQEIWPRAEVGVQNHDVVSRRAGERVLKVAGFLKVPTIRTHDVVESEMCGEAPDLAAIAVVEKD